MPLINCKVNVTPAIVSVIFARWQHSQCINLCQGHAAICAPRPTVAQALEVWSQ